MVEEIKLDPHVIELLRNAKAENKTEGDPVTQLEHSSLVTEGEIKNDLNQKSTQLTAELEAKTVAPKISDVEKPKTAAEEYLERLEQYAKKLGTSVEYLKTVAAANSTEPTSVSSHMIAEQKAKDEQEVKAAIGKAITGMGIAAGVSFAGQAYAADSGNRSAPSPQMSLLKISEIALNQA